MGLFANLKEMVKDLINPPSTEERLARTKAEKFAEENRPRTTKEMREKAVHQLRDRTDPTDPDELRAAQAQAQQILGGKFDNQLHAMQSEKIGNISKARDATDPTDHDAMLALQKEARRIAAGPALPEDIMLQAQRAGAAIKESRLPDRGTADQQRNFEAMSPEAQKAEVDSAHAAGNAVNHARDGSRGR